MMIPTTNVADQIPVGLVPPGAVIPTGLHSLETARKVTLQGLGVVVRPDGSYYVPGWCSWLPFSSFNDACKPPTEQEFLNDQMSSVGPAAKANPVLVAELKEAWKSAEQMMCEEDPASCAELEFARKYPTASAAIGTGTAAQTVVHTAEDAAAAAKKLTEVPMWLWLAGAAGVGLLVLSAGRK